MTNAFLNDKKHQVLFYFRFCLALGCIGFFVLMENPSIVAKIAHTNTQTIFIGKTLILVFAEILLFASLLCISRTFWLLKYGILTLVCFSSLVFDVYFLASGKTIEYQEFLILYQNARVNFFDSLEMYGGFIFTSSLRCILLALGFLLMPTPPPHKTKFTNALIGLGSFIFLVFLVALTCIFRQGAATNKLPAPASLYGLFLAYQYDRINNPYIYQYTSNKVVPIAQSAYQNIILIIDESIRADYSPAPIMIQSLTHWEIYDYGIATSYTNSSAPSNVLLRKGARFETLIQDFYHHPLIWFYAKQAGYKTYLIDLQDNGMGHDYFDSQERQMIDEILPTRGLKNDSDVLKRLNYLNQKEKTFTIIIKNGSHFPYNGYPKDYQIPNNPDLYKTATPLRKKYLKNVSFQTYEFWKGFAKLQIKKATFIIYTSDHGQNLEDVAGLTHGSTSSPYKGEGLVPLILLSNIHNPSLMRFLKTNYDQASHFNIFPTLLDMMGYPSLQMGFSQHSTSLIYKTKRINGFFYGVPFGYFGKKPDFHELQNRKLK